MSNPEVGPPQDRTAESIDNISRMLAKKADKVDSYIQLAPFAPDGFSQVGRVSDSELYVKETGTTPGTVKSPTKIALNGSGHFRAKVDTDSGVARGTIENKNTGDTEHVLDEQDTRKAAAAALWEKRRELRHREDLINKAGSTALASILGK